MLKLIQNNGLGLLVGAIIGFILPIYIVLPVLLIVGWLTLKD